MVVFASKGLGMKFKDEIRVVENIAKAVVSLIEVFG